MHRCKRFAGTLAAAVPLLAAGCAAPSNPWQFATPPTTVEATAAAERPGAERITIVVGEFVDPSKAPNYSGGVGRSLSAALSRALMNDGRYNVLIREDLSIRVGRVIRNTALDHHDELTRLSREHPDVDYVVTGKVTDFHHTGDLPGEVSRWGVFGRRNEAIAAIDVRIVDMQSRRVVGADHLKGTAPAGRTASLELYRNIAIDSYLFWSTPLGRASKRAIEQAVARTEAVIPPRAMASARGEPAPGDPQVLNAWGRRIEIIGGTNAGLVRGGRYYLLQQAADGGDWTPVRDRITDQPLMVSILTVDPTSSRGMLMGERPRDFELRGALLRPSLLPASTTAVSSGDPAATGDQTAATTPSP